MTATSPKAKGPIRIDLQAVLASKLGKRSRFVPRFLVRRLEKIIRAERLNKLLADNYPAKGADFCRGVLDDLRVSVTAKGAGNLPSPDHRRVVIVSNHPLGGLDGMALIDYFTKYFGSPVYFVVNDLLMALEPLNDVFVPVNKHGSQSRKAAADLDGAFASDRPVIVFPAGLVSRLGKKGHIADLEWKKMFVNRAIASGRDVIPVYFSGHNSKSFYRLARRRKQLGINFNIEMVYLPREVFRSEGKSFEIHIGPLIPVRELKGGKEAAITSLKIREKVYNLAR
ncbi:MAG: 1-acyl-sn-glycerol-3-phosphate acyltransferase [Muribaculaceae bacterium]|nr:1-acyl-sn-glycerol-3-phosphate acyltransferase [Muribaculaceae bacterium]